MTVELITWDANCEDVLYDSVLGHYVCGNLHRCHAMHLLKHFSPEYDEERALEEELANANDNASASTHLDDDYYTPNFDTFLHIVEDAEVEEVTQRAEKRLVQDASGKGKKVSRKLDRVGEMTMALREYTAMSRDKFSGKLGKGSGSFEQFA
nr:hypothetical protein CFP56_15134 [Quercus suber]